MRKLCLEMPAPTLASPALGDAPDPSSLSNIREKAVRICETSNQSRYAQIHQIDIDFRVSRVMSTSEQIRISALSISEGPHIYFVVIVLCHCIT